MSDPALWTLIGLAALLFGLCGLMATGLLTPRRFAQAVGGVALGALVGAAWLHGGLGHG